LIQFSFLSLKIYEFSYFNQILLSLFNVSNAFYEAFELFTPIDTFSFQW